MSVEGFRILGNRITIDFPQQGIIGIFGNNESGKSTLFDAIEFALFGLSPRNYTREEIVTWGKDKLSVTLDFSSGNKKYRIERTLTKRSNNAKLVELDENGALALSEIKSVTAVQQTIEEILGLDGNSYSKLIYIRQKELDVLKELEKQDRTQLINSVMGIDIFDEAQDHINDDSKVKKDQFDSLDLVVSHLKENHDRYVIKLRDKDALQAELETLSENILQIETEYSNLKSKLEELNWVSQYLAKETLLNTTKGQLSIINSTISKHASEQTRLKICTELYEKVKPEYTKLNEGWEKIGGKENELDTTNALIRDLKGKLPQVDKQESFNRSNRSSQLMKAILFLVVGAVSSVLAISLWFFIVPGVIMIAISILLFQKYKRTLDTILIDDTKVQLLQTQIKSNEEKSIQAAKELKELEFQYGVKSKMDIKQKIEILDSKIRSETGLSSLSSLAGLQGMISKIESDLGDTPINDLERRAHKVGSEIKEIENQLSTLIESKPKNAEPSMSLEQFNEFSQKFKEITERLSELNDKKGELIGKIAQLKCDCDELKKDFDQFPNSKKELDDLNKEIQLLGFVVEQFKRVSANLRSKVIPLATTEINYMLPGITDNRYSYLEISEDLKFDVWTERTGGLKDRELFSGGTQDQFLIVLRLAFTKSILDLRMRADEYCLFMDETISSSDESRKNGIFQLLQKTLKTFKQIFIIAHEDISSFVDYHLVFEIGDGGYSVIKTKSWQEC